MKLRAGDHVLMDSRSGLLAERLPRPEVEELVLEEVPDVTYADVGGLDDQIEHDPGRGRAARTCTPTCSSSTSCSRRRASCCTGLPAAARRSSRRRWRTRWRSRVAEKTGNQEARSYFLNIKGPELLNKYVGETERQIRLIFQRAREKSEEGVPGHRVLRRDGLAVPHPRHRDLVRHREHDRAAAARRDRRRREPEERDRDRRVEPRGPHRPRDPAPRPPRREDQDRAARRGERRRRSSPSTSRPTCRSPTTRRKQPRRARQGRRRR